MEPLAHWTNCGSSATIGIRPVVHIQVSGHSLLDRSAKKFSLVPNNWQFQPGHHSGIALPGRLEASKHPARYRVTWQALSLEVTWQARSLETPAHEAGAELLAAISYPWFACSWCRPKPSCACKTAPCFARWESGDRTHLKKCPHENLTRSTAN